MYNFKALDLVNDNAQKLKSEGRETNMKNVVKIIATLALTVLAQWYTVVENGHWGIGGNVFVPLLCGLVFWGVPALLKPVKKGGE